MAANSSAARCTLEPVPVEAKFELAGLLLRQRDQFRDRVRRHRRMHQHDIGARRDQADRREILARVVADVGIERRIDRKRARSRSAACSRRARPSRPGAWRWCRRRRRGSRPRWCWPSARAHPLGDDAGEHVVAAAGGVGDDQRDRPGRIVRRVRSRRCSPEVPPRSAARAATASSLIPPWRRTSSRSPTIWSLRLSMSAAYSSGVDGERLGAVGGHALACVGPAMTASRSAALSLSMIGFGVPAGATMP